MHWCRSIAIVVVLLFPSLSTADTTDVTGLQQASEIYRALTNRPDKRVPRIWSGTEIICVVAQNEHAVQVLDFISALNSGYGTEFSVVSVVDHLTCPTSTSFFILTEAAASPERLADVLEDLHGTRPDFFGYTVRGGLSLTLPGIPAREFVFFNALSKPVHSDPHPSKSIMMEEVLHSLTGLGDLPSTRIISLLGEDSGVVDYDHWFTQNPKGLCNADLYLLEMVIGPNVRATTVRTTSLKWFYENQQDIDFSVANAKIELSDFLDPRCI